MTANLPEFLGVAKAEAATPVALPAGLDRVRFQPYRGGLKRAFDVAAILVAAPVLVPVMGAIALAITLDGGRPFYAQERVGKGGRSFRMWKFRTMVHNADGKLEAHLAADPALRAEWDLTQKLQNDPRVTAFGAFLRKSSLDELPQLWNVLTGDMSLVGPRPMMVSQKVLYPGAGYFRVRPGVTGYWQVAGRSRTSFEARAGFDDAYEAELSLGTDLKVLARTVTTVLKGTGV